MKVRTMLLLVVAVSGGLAVRYATSRLTIGENHRPEEPRIKVLVARGTLSSLTLINKPEEMFVEREVPVADVSDKTIKSFEVLQDRRLNKRVTEGMSVTTEDLVGRGLEGGSSVKPGLRSLTVKTAFAEGVLPTSRVDVYCWLDNVDDNQVPPKPMLTDMLVLGVEFPKGRIEGSPCFEVTLAVLPEESTRLLLAQRLGKLMLAPRPIGDAAAKKPVGH